MKMIPSNSKECFRHFKGMKVTGVLFDTFPLGHGDESKGNTTLIFENGEGLTYSSNGSYWIENARDVKTAIATKKEELAAVQRKLTEWLIDAGEIAV